MTCRSIIHAAALAGYRTDLFTTRYDPDVANDPVVHSLLPRVTRFLPYGWLRHVAEPELHRRYLAALAEGDIAYLWTLAPVSLFEALRTRGHNIVSEAVNTRMAVAKPLLDAAYEAAGMPTTHGITNARIADQDARYALCSAIFVPSPGTEAAFAGTGLEQRLIPASYGTWVPPSVPFRRPKQQDEIVTFLFIGTLCVRKGIPQLLAAWKNAPKNARLRLVGGMEPGFAARFRSALSAPNVSVAEFTRDVTREYNAADVFVQPAIEEGDSIVTYEAAAQGLPILASRPGAGRIGAETDAITLVNPADTAAFRSAIAAFASSQDLRFEWGNRARQAVLSYDWRHVGPRRYASLHRFFGGLA